MALEFSKKIEKYYITDSMNNMVFEYTFDTLDGVLDGAVKGIIYENSRSIALSNTRNGVDVKLNLVSVEADNISGIAQKLQEDLTSIYNNYQNYIST